MACITLLAQPMAVATTKFARAIHYEDACTRQSESNVERNTLRMNWVVVTDSTGQQRLRMRWTPADGSTRGTV